MLLCGELWEFQNGIGILFWFCFVLIGKWNWELKCLLVDLFFFLLGSSQRRSAAMLDSDDTDSVSSSSTTRSDMMLSGLEEVQFDKETVLDQCLDALYEKRFDYT